MLLNVPITCNDGTDDRIFNWLMQSPGETAGLYKETAADPSAVSQLKSAHALQKDKRKRHLFQSSEIIALVNPDTDGPTDDLVQVNLTIVHNKKHAVADIEKRVKILLAAAGVAGFTLAITSGEI